MPPRKKARLCIKGWNEDVSNLETFAPVVRFETVLTAVSHAAHADLELWSVDVCSAYMCNFCTIFCTVLAGVAQLRVVVKPCLIDLVLGLIGGPA